MALRGVVAALAAAAIVLAVPAVVAQAPTGPSDDHLWLHADSGSVWMNTLAQDAEDSPGHFVLLPGAPQGGGPDALNFSLRPENLTQTLYFDAGNPSVVQLWLGSAYIIGPEPFVAPIVGVTANVTLLTGSTVLANGTNSSSFEPLEAEAPAVPLNVSLPARVASVVPSDGNLVLRVVLSYDIQNPLPSNPIAFFVLTGGDDGDESSSLTLGLEPAPNPPPPPGQPSITLASAEPTRQGEAGQVIDYGVRVQNSGGAAGTVSLAVESPPAGLSVAFAPATLHVVAGAIEDAMLRVTIDPAMQPGDYGIHVVALLGDDQAASMLLGLIVVEPSPSPSPSPSASPSPSRESPDPSDDDAPASGAPGPGLIWLAVCVAAGALVASFRLRSR